MVPLLDFIADIWYNSSMIIELIINMPMEIKLLLLFGIVMMIKEFIKNDTQDISTMW